MPSAINSDNEKLDRYMRLSEVARVLDVGKSTIYYFIKRKGDFPRQYKLGSKLAVWKESEIRAYMDKQT